MSLYTWKCPRTICGGTTLGTDIDFSVPPTCSNRHRATNMQKISGPEAGGTTHTNTKETTNMPTATTTRDCECNAEPTDRPHVYTSCGRLTGGAFAQGHDAKLKSALIKAHLAGEEYKVVPPGGKRAKAFDPEAVAAERGWTRFLEKAVEVEANRENKRAERAARRREQRAAAKAAEETPGDAE